MTKEQIISKLMLNPKYDSAWIDKASDLIATNSYIESYLAQFSADQLNILSQVIAKYGNMSAEPDDAFVEIMSNAELNLSQMQILLTAKNAGVETDKLSRIASHHIPYGVMNYLAQAMIDGLNLAEEITITRFNIDQIYEIVAGFHAGVDYKCYADSNIPAECMAVIRAGLEAGYDVSYIMNTKKIVFELPKEDDLMQIVAEYDSNIKDAESKGEDSSELHKTRDRVFNNLKKVREINGTSEEEK